MGNPFETFQIRALCSHPFVENDRCIDCGSRGATLSARTVAAGPLGTTTATAEAYLAKPHD